MFERAQALARAENRTMSELVREALRRYQFEKDMAKLQAHMVAIADQTGVHTEEDVVRAVKEFRREEALKALEADSVLV
jgi:KaiC/GvpD/RAD55 family RecA-like ATPase